MYKSQANFGEGILKNNQLLVYLDKNLCKTLAKVKFVP